MTRTFVLRAVAQLAPFSGPAVVPGRYRVYAMLGTTAHERRLRSPTITFEVR